MIISKEDLISSSDLDFTRTDPNHRSSVDLWNQKRLPSYLFSKHHGNRRKSYAIITGLGNAIDIQFKEAGGRLLSLWAASDEPHSFFVPAYV
jgi:hypothetical protein